ncbi:hypothetical protein [Hymenobacter coccineus]|uniref:hypothetical protein n=1 Tax=Hymenobacter coccineus TaxID=1908235 RepID=UPI0013014727|nr:hypothetical protein [Hymenobacter coccineus]
MNNTSSLSGNSNTVTVVENRSVAAPVARGPLVAGGAAVSGTSAEAVGSTITVAKAGTSIGTTTVQSNGTWSLTGLASTVLTTGSVITATVQPTGYPSSAASNSVTVQAATTVTPTITGAYSEGGTTVTGTLNAAAPANTVLTLYEDDAAIGTVALATGTTSWTVTLSNATGAPALYAGGVLVASAAESGKTAGPNSNAVTVGCSTLTAGNSVTVDRNPVCENDVVTVTINNSQDGIIYTLRNDANGQALGTSRTGNGGAITIPTSPLTASVVIRIEALSLGATNCTQVLTAKPAITVYALPANSLALSATPTTVCRNSSATVLVGNSQTGVRYQLRNNNTNTDAGSPVDGTGGTLSLPTGPVTATTTYSVLATDVTHPHQLLALRQRQHHDYGRLPGRLLVAKFLQRRSGHRRQGTRHRDGCRRQHHQCSVGQWHRLAPQHEPANQWPGGGNGGGGPGRLHLPSDDYRRGGQRHHAERCRYRGR